MAAPQVNQQLPPASLPSSTPSQSMLGAPPRFTPVNSERASPAVSSAAPLPPSQLVAAASQQSQTDALQSQQYSQSQSQSQTIVGASQPPQPPRQSPTYVPIAAAAPAMSSQVNGIAHKRKRSDTEEAPRPKPAPSTESTMSARESQNTADEREVHPAPMQSHIPHTQHGLTPAEPSPAMQSRPVEDDIDVAKAAIRTLHHEGSYPYYDSHSSEEHNKDMMRRSHSLDESGDESDQLGSEHGSQMQNSEYPQVGANGVVRNAPSEHRRRKRVFSNRTKTGCLTCRSRKKKCDEAKPECNNCHKGGFVCQGYNQRQTWRPATNTNKPVMVHMKDGTAMIASETHSMYPGHDSYHDHHHSQGRPGPPHHSHSHSHGPPPPSAPMQQQPGPLPRHHMEISPPPYRSHSGPTPPHDPRQQYIVIPEDERMAYERREPHPGSRGPSMPAQQQPPPPPPPSYPDAQRYPPRMHDGSNGQHAMQGPPPPPNAALGPPPQHQPLPGHLVPYQQGRMIEPGPPQHHHHGHPPAPGPPPAHQAPVPMGHHGQRRPMTEKEKMLAGELYSPSTPELVDERELCRAACWRFNNAGNPTLGVSRDERGRLFREILRPKQLPGVINGGTPTSPIGSVGEDVVVEAPFNCDYGYNITIGDGVYIGPNCRILDPCSVIIKARSYIGPDVRIYAATHPVDPRKRNGSRGTEHGRRVVIDEDCWLGGGVTILPGIQIGRGSTVGAGSVVTREVPPFAVVAGNPARVIRGIYSNPPE